MTYRSKCPERVLQELTHLTRTYGLKRFDSVDNILDVRYIQTLFPELIRFGPEVELFYETKSNLRFEQLRILRDGGVRALQPGIESFSNQVLRLMRKGCTGLQNLQFLRWCDELGIRVAWNLIYGFPDEPPSEYQRMAEIIPLLTHLQPPSFCVRVRMDRFSPLFRNSEEFGIANVRPMLAYSYAFPLEQQQLARLAYFFEFDYADGRNPADYTGDVVREVALWSESTKTMRPRLDLFQVGPVVLINDTRQCAVKPTQVLGGLGARVYLMCDVAHTLAGLIRKLSHPVGEEKLRAILQGFLAAKLMVEIEGQYLSLAIIRTRAQSEAHHRGAEHRHTAPQLTTVA